MKSVMDLVRRGGPYAPETQLLGEIPSVIPDIPVSAVLLFLFLIAGVASFIIFIRNKKSGHKFIVNGALFGFGKIRIGTFSLRMAWACHPTSVKLGLASSVFVYAGTIILFGINFIFTLRIIRAQHPSFGWSTPVKAVFIMLFVVVILSLIAVIVAVLQSFFTLDPEIHRIDRIVQLYGLTCFATAAFLPIPVILVSTLLGQLPSIKRHRQANPTDKFGKGRMRTKIWVALIASFILTLGAAFRTGANFAPPTPVFVPGPGPATPSATPWYLSRASFYAFNFATELVVVAMWLISRVDKTFFVPDKSEGAYYPPPAPRHYGIDSGLSSVWSIQAFHGPSDIMPGEAGIPEDDEVDYDKTTSGLTSMTNSERSSVMDAEKRKRYRGSWQLEGPHGVMRYF